MFIKIRCVHDKTVAFDDYNISINGRFILFTLASGILYIIV